MNPKESGIIRDYIFLGVDVALLEELCHCGSRILGFMYAHVTQSVLIDFFLPSCCLWNMYNSQLPLYLKPTMSQHGHNGLELWIVNEPPQLNVFLHKSYHGHGVSSQQ